MLEKINKLINNGQPIFGVFDKVVHINYLDYDSYLLSGKKVNQLKKQLRANQFCFIQIVQHPYRLCVAVATLNWVTSSFCYLYNENDNSIELVESLQPFTHKTQFNQSTYQGKITFKSKKLTVDMDFNEIGLDISIESNIVCLKANLNRPYDPLSVCTPTGRTGWTYTQKEPINEIVGELILKSESVDLAGATATLDWSVGYMRRVTNWFWSCITAYLQDGRYFALNLAMGVNETGASENICWVDGKRYHLPAVMFRRGKGREEWQISNQPLNWSKVEINLTFTPINCYQKSDRLMVVDSIFEQWIGYYSGIIILDGESITINKVIGLAEDHYAKW